MPDPTVHLHSTTDAKVWADEFCKRWPNALCQIEGKEDGDEFHSTMLGWFANAIMAGVDSVPRPDTSDEKVEAIAKLVYDAMLFDRNRPIVMIPWVDGGNSLAQDEARRAARKIIQEIAG